MDGEVVDVAVLQNINGLALTVFASYTSSPLSDKLVILSLSEMRTLNLRSNISILFSRLELAVSLKSPF